MSMLPDPHDPVPGIVQAQKREWEQIIAEINHYAQLDDETALEMGDRFVEVEKFYGRDSLKQAAEQGNVSWSVARQRHWVAKTLPKGHPVRQKLADTHLTFSHLRVLAGTKDPEDWAKKAVDEGMTVAKLTRAVQDAGDLQAQAEGQPCIQCNKPLPESGEIVSFTIVGRGRARCCSITHAAQYFTELAKENPDAGDDPFVAEE